MLIILSPHVYKFVVYMRSIASHKKRIQYFCKNELLYSNKREKVIKMQITQIDLEHMSKAALDLEISHLIKQNDSAFRR